MDGNIFHYSLYPNGKAIDKYAPNPSQRDKVENHVTAHDRELDFGVEHDGDDSAVDGEHEHGAAKQPRYREGTAIRCGVAVGCDTTVRLVVLGHVDVPDTTRTLVTRSR